MTNLIEAIYNNTMNNGDDLKSFWDVMNELEETTIPASYGDDTQVPLLKEDNKSIELREFFDREAPYGEALHLDQEELEELSEQGLEWEHLGSDNTFNYASLIERDFSFNVFKSDIDTILATFNISTGLDPRGSYSTGFAMLFNSYEAYTEFMCGQFDLFNIELRFTDKEGEERRELFEVGGALFSNELELYCEFEGIQEFIEVDGFDESSLLEAVKELPLYEGIKDLELKFL